jgi:hypothetical protein
MKHLTKLFAITALASGMVVTSATHAHGIWFAPRAGQLGLIYGLGADDLDSVKRLRYVENVSGYDVDWNPVPTSLRIAGPLLLVDSDDQPSVVAAVMDYGTWTKAPDGQWHWKDKKEVPGALMSSRSFKYTVHIAEPLKSPMPALVGHTLQIIPVETALPELLGQTVTLRVLHKGQPVEGAAVLRDFVNDPDAEPLMTGADGTVSIKVRNQGLNVISASYYHEAEDSTELDEISHRATLTFVLPHEPE